MDVALKLLQALAMLEPLAADALPVIEGLIAGKAPTDTDIATLQSVTTAINVQAAAAEKEAGALG